MSKRSQDRLTLQAALRRWCDEELVESVLAEERRHTAARMAGYPRGCLSPSRELRRLEDGELSEKAPSFTGLDVAWEELENDLIQRVAASKFFLSGVQTQPDLKKERTSIPGA